METVKREKTFKSEFIYLLQSSHQTYSENTNPLAVLFFCSVNSLLAIENFQIHGGNR